MEQSCLSSSTADVCSGQGNLASLAEGTSELHLLPRPSAWLPRLISEFGIQVFLERITSWGRWTTAENTSRGHRGGPACLLTEHHNPCRLDRHPGAPRPQQIGVPGLPLLFAGGLSPASLDAFGNSDFSPCVYTVAKSFMELGAEAEPAILLRAGRLGHAAPSARGAAAAGPPGLNREPREDEVPAVERDGEPRRRADPVLWLCTAMPSIAW